MKKTITASAMAFVIFAGALSVITEPCRAGDSKQKSSNPTETKPRPGAFIPKSLDLTEDQLMSVSPPSEESVRRQYGHLWSTPDESAPDWEKDPRILEEAVKEAERLGLDIDYYIIQGDGDGLLEAVRNSKETGELPPPMKDPESYPIEYIPFTPRQKADWEEDPNLLIKAVLEAEQMGLDVDDYIIYGDLEGLIEAVGKAKEERDIRAQEPSFEGGEDRGVMSGSALDRYSDDRAAQRQQQVADSSAMMQYEADMTQAAQAGDDAVREAAAIIERAGRESQAQADQSARSSAQAARESGWGATLGDAISTGIQQGAEAFGATLGGAAADKASGEIFGTSRRDREASKPADETATAATETGPSAAPASGATPTERRASRPTTTSSESGQAPGPPPKESGASPVAVSPGRRRGKGPRTSGEEAGPMVTCPACARTFRGIAGQGVPCPYCVTMNCPRCGYSRTYTRGQEPTSCPRCTNE